MAGVQGHSLQQVLMVCWEADGLWAKPHQSAEGQFVSKVSKSGHRHFDVALLTNHAEGIS